MSPTPTPHDTEAWLTAHGWSATRDIGARADELIAARVQNAEKQGESLVPFAAAAYFLRSFGELTLPLDEDIDLLLTPAYGWNGDAAEIAELAGLLGEPLFPVGFETGENGQLLVSTRGRFFYLHESGCYYLGESALEALGQRLGGGQMRGAREFYV
ncbi:SUKH-3 domain-containing protein [Kitasatospora sp. HPMI-4]|uniref:SUKH-3 domain-containing protein n=1 Tax=Kitasatospora sp. HPMI-4 TaxID=3448443 RepID=UPI003F1C8DAF